MGLASSVKPHSAGRIGSEPPADARAGTAARIVAGGGSSKNGTYRSYVSATTPVERLQELVHQGLPTATIERLRVTHPADDDNVWFVQQGGREVQFECHPGGKPPFLVEGSGLDQRRTFGSAEDAARLIVEWLSH